MDKQPVGQLPDLTQSNNDDEIMVITNSEYNQLKKEKISNFITDLTSTDENNALIKGTDNKLFVTDFGNADNIINGTIDTERLPNSGVTAGEYIYPTNMQVNNKGQIVSVENGVTADITKEQIDTVAARPLSDNACTQENFPDEYSYWVDQAHSTFDLNKFEVVGSPTISEDGIGSKFNNANYLKTGFTLGDLLNKSWSITGVTIDKNQTSEIVYPIYLSKPGFGSFGNLVFDYNTNVLSFTAAIGTTTDGAGTKIQKNIGNFDKLIPRLDFNYVTGTYSLYYDIGNGWKLAGTYTPTSDNKQLYYINTEQSYPLLLYLGYITNSRIDLKTYNVMIDNQPAFTGNQTGIDTIIEPNYEIVGSPTITTDGIASGFNASNYLIPSLTPFSSNNWGFEATFIPQNNTVDDKNQCIFAITNNFSILTNRYGTKISITLQNPDTQQQLLSTGEIGNLNINLINKIKIMYVNQILYVYINEELTYNTTIDLDNFKFSNNNPFIGYTPSPSYNRFYGSIDLNSIKFYSNSSLIYQLCLYLPYTETTGGTKVVDAAYYDRVQSCYEQTGQALYLTLDEQNQQYYLPQGTVSGMISQNKQKIDELDTTLTADILQAMPVGASIAYEGTTAPDGWFAESGTEIQQSAYPLLYAVVGDKYNLETTQEGYFRLPDTNISSRFYEGSTTPGTLTDAGLPNITATGTGMGVGVIVQVGGAAYDSGVNAERIQGGNQDGKRIDFNASRSSSIYGKSTTVQPKSITKFFIIKHD